MTDTDRLAALLHADFMEAVPTHQRYPAPCSVCEGRAARLIAAGVTLQPAEGLDVDRLIESIAYMGVIDIHQQVCAWCGMRYGYPHRDYCPITAQGPALRAALTPEDDHE